MLNASKVRLSPPYTRALHIDLKAIEEGIPTASLTHFVDALGISTREVQEVVIPTRTLKHRRARKEPLSVDESDRLARMARIVDFAFKVFGENRGAALEWMSAPKRRFDGRTPFSMLRTDMGGRAVEEMLGQLDEGFFA